MRGPRMRPRAGPREAAMLLRNAHAGLIEARRLETRFKQSRIQAGEGKESQARDTEDGKGAATVWAKIINSQALGGVLGGGVPLSYDWHSNDRGPDGQGSSMASNRYKQGGLAAALAARERLGPWSGTTKFTVRATSALRQRRGLAMPPYSIGGRCVAG
jgi:hypothetical protein